MKRIKTLSTISLATILAGAMIAVSTPFQSASANEGTITPGDTIDLKDNVVSELQFNQNNTILSSKPYYSFSKFVPPVYDTNTRQWQMAQSRDTDSGSSSVAFNRPFDLSQDFHVIAHSNLASDDHVRFNTDLMGLVITTTKPEKLADTQVIKFKQNAGYATDDVKWQVVLGTQADMGSDRNAHSNVVRETKSGVKSNEIINTFRTSNDYFKPVKDINETYDIRYDHGTGYVTFSVPNQKTTDVLKVPAGVSRLYIGTLLVNAGVGEDHDYGGMTIDHLEGSYATPSTVVNYINKNVPDPNSSDHFLGKSTTINSVVGENLSVSGNDFGSDGYSWDAPNFHAASLMDLPADRKSRTIVAKEETDNKPNVINVVYDAMVGTLPYQIIDDTDGSSAVNQNGKIPLKIGSSYSYDTDNISDAIDIPKFTKVVKVTDGTGIVTADANNHVNNSAVIVHVVHDTSKVEQTFTRTIQYQLGPNVVQPTQPGKNIVLPKDFEQTVSGLLVTDLYQQAQDQSAGKTYQPYFDKPIQFEKSASPNIEGVQPDINEVPAETIKPGDNQSQRVMVTYNGFLGIYTPDFDFGNIVVGDKYFNGIDAKNVEKMKGVLAVSDTDKNKDKANWTLNVELDKGFLAGGATLELMDGQKSVDDSGQQTLLTKKDVGSLASNTGITEIINQETLKQYPSAVAVKFGKFNQNSYKLSDLPKEYQGTMTWTLGVTP